MLLAHLLSGCQIVSGLDELEVERAASSNSAGVAAGAMRAVAVRADAGAPTQMPDASRESEERDGGVRIGRPDAAVGRIVADAGRSVAGGQSGSAGSMVAGAGSSGSSSASHAAGSSGKGEDASVEIEVGADRKLGNTNLSVSDILGYYSGNWGQMILRTQGAEIIGVYEHRDGTLIGEIDDEGVFVGWWTQLPSRTGLDAGEVEFRWSKSADGGAVALDGRWRYGTDGEWLENWDVARVTDRSAPSQLSDRFERTDDFRRRP